NHDLKRYLRLPDAVANQRAWIIRDGRGCSWPRIGCGRYGFSSAATSSAVSFTSTAAIASLRCASLVAPMIGAVTPGACRIHAHATCDGVTLRSLAICSTTLNTSKSYSRKYIFLAK